VRNENASIKISDGANLVIDNEVKAFKGTLKRDKNGTLSGEFVTFNLGTYEDCMKKMDLTGRLYSDDNQSVILNGDETLKGCGNKLEHKLRLNGKSNRLEGDMLFNEDIDFQDVNSSCTFAVARKVNKNINLNNGTLYLEEDLRFVDGCKINGPGHVHLNDRSLIFGAQELTCDTPICFDHGNDIVINANFHLNQTWTFCGGLNSIVGRGHNLVLGEHGNIVVAGGSCLKFHDITIQGVAGNNIRCLDSTGSFIFQKAIWMQDSNYSLTVGSFTVVKDMVLVGNHTFAYQSAMTSTVAKNSSFSLDRNMTFSYDPPVARNNLLEFEDGTSILCLDAATLHTTHTGLQLINGTMLVNRNTTFRVESRINSENNSESKGIIEIGDGNAAHDMMCQILQGTTFNVTEGTLKYNNVSSNSWDMIFNTSILKIHAGAQLFLNQSLDLGDGRLALHRQATLTKASGKELVGSVHVF